jgi:hypothetical protein
MLFEVSYILAVVLLESGIGCLDISPMTSMRYGMHEVGQSGGLVSETRRARGREGYARRQANHNLLAISPWRPYHVSKTFQAKGGVIPGPKIVD